MTRVLGVFGATLVLMAVSASPSYAWKVVGHVYCDSNQNGLVDATDAPIAGARLVVTATDNSFTGEDLTDATGYYRIGLPDFGNSYSIAIDVGSLPAGSVVLSPAGGTQGSRISI